MNDRGESQTRRTRDLPARFGELWRKGQRPDLAAFLAGAGPLTPQQLLAVLRIDQEERWRAGERVAAEAYFDAHPTLKGDPEIALELIYCEYLLREALGEQPNLDEFLARFPDHADRLRQQIAWHAALDEETVHLSSVPPGDLLPATLLTSPTELERRPREPLTIPGYDLVRELGHGGMGVVYEARDTRHGRPVALKVMQWFDPAALYRFKQEFRTLAGLNHPNLVTLYELVADGRQWYFTMELLDGVDFLTHVHAPAGPVRLARLRECLAQLAQGVLALHAAGKLHRDIKPRNVLVSRAGRVVLLDFGLAADLDRSGQYLSHHPGLLGTVDYMAPEQAAARPVSPASDWYAVGVMLYHALAGCTPFAGNPYEILAAKQQRDPPPLEVSPEVPDDLARLCMDLLQREPADRPRGPEILRRLQADSPQSSVPSPPSSEVPLVGRRPHLEALDDAFRATRQGKTVVVAVHGRSGAGKSALLRSFLDGLTDRGEAVVLAGRCYEQESVPYKALDSLIDVLTRYLDGLPAAEVQALLPRYILALARLFPVLRRVDAVASAPTLSGDVSDPVEVRRRALTALRDLLGRLGDRRPLVVAIDDLQWGDSDSAALLEDLLAPPDPPVLLLAGAYRSEDEQSSPFLAAFHKLQESAPVEGRRLAVEPLTPQERRELALMLLGSDDPVAAAHAEAIGRQSGGYPFFVHELVRYLHGGQSLQEAGSGSYSLRDMLWERVMRLPEEAQRLLEVVAVAGRPLRQEDACRAADLGGEELQALAQLRAARLLRSAGPAERGEIETYHDRVRETVTVRLEPEVRKRHHRRLAEVLEAAGAADAELLAVHLEAGGELVRAGGYYARAAGQAAQALAFDRSASLYGRALELLGVKGDEERRLRARRGDALAGAGRGAEAAREYLAAAETSEAGEALDLRRRAVLQLLSSGHIDAGLAALRKVLTDVGLHLPHTPRAALWGLLGQRALLYLRGLRFRRCEAECIPAAELMRLDVCLSAAVGVSIVDTVQGGYFQAQALRLALRAGEPGRLVPALALEGAHESIGGARKRRRADRMLRAADGLARELGRPYELGVVAMARGIAAALAGEWEDGRAFCDEAAAIFRNKCTGVPWELGTSHRFALWPLMFMGEVAEIARRLPGLIKEAKERDDLYGVTNLCLGMRTFVHLAADEPETARRELAEAMDRWSHHGFHVQHQNRLYDESQIDLYQGDAAAAWRRITETWPLLGRSHHLRVQQVRIYQVHLRGRAALAAGGDPTLVRSARRDARALWHERAPWAQALARLLEAGVAARRGDGQAAGLLRDAAERCDAAKMRLYAAAARRRLGELTGGEEGRALVAEADKWMAGQGVANPVRMTALLVPLAQK
jgi:hypothetical protein